jgi:PPOX class probable F420-dependent enzyme
MASMTQDERDEFLKGTWIAKLATLNADGSPNIVPVWYEWTGSDVLLFTTRGTAKVRRIERDSRVALSVEAPAGAMEAWVTIEGTASIEAEGAWDLILRLTPKYYDAERAADTLQSWEQIKDDWVLIRITPIRIRSLAPGT